MSKILIMIMIVQAATATVFDDRTRPLETPPVRIVRFPPAMLPS